MRFLALLACLAIVMPAVASAGPKSTKSLVFDGGPLDFGVNLDPPVNDLCSGAILIPCGNIDLSGHTGMAANDYTPSDSVCTGFLAVGADVVYRLDVAAGDSLWLDYSTVFDGSVYIVTDCADVSGTCVVGRDSMNTAGIERIRHEFTSPGSYYLILDAFGVGGGAWTAAGQLVCGSTPLPPNDLCATALPLLCGAFNLSGTTEFALDDYGFPSAGESCTGDVADGRDVVYKINATAGDSLWIDYTTTADGSVYLLTVCDATGSSCVAGADDTGGGGTESLRYKFAFSGPHYLILDSQAPNSFGNWTAVGGVDCGLSVPSNDLCATAIPIPCGDIALSGSTRLAVNNYAFTSESVSCTDYLADGRDIVYSVNANAGDSLWINYTSTSDASIYIVTNCDSIVTSCVKGVDEHIEGDPEFLRYTFTASGTYYIILDSYGLDTWGDWEAIGGRICTLVDVDPRRAAGPLAFAGTYPNPFRESTILEYTLASAARTSLRVYDLQGRRVRLLFEGVQEAGRHRTTWNGRDDHGAGVVPGVYFAQLESDGQVAKRRLIFVR